MPREFHHVLSRRRAPAALLMALPKTLPAGIRAAGFLVLYGAARIGLGAVRLDPSFLFGLQIEQLLAIGAVVFGVAFGLRPLLRRELLGSRLQLARKRRAAPVSPRRV